MLKDKSKTRGNEPSGMVRAVTRAIAILKAFEGGSRLELREISTRAGLDRGTARRLLMTLMAEGLVIQYDSKGEYALGPEIRRLAANAEDLDLRQTLAPHLEQLADELGITAFLSVYRDHSAICIDRYHNVNGMEVGWWRVGGTLAINCGAAPKVLLAWQSEQEIKRMLNGKLLALTPRSIVNREALARRLQAIRKRGWELAIDDVAVGLSALAVPVQDEHGKLFGAISIAGLTPQMVQRSKPVFLDRLLGTRDILNKATRLAGQDPKGK